MHWMILPYRRYADFKGRSRRSEYWFFYLFVTVVMTALLLGMFGTTFTTLMAVAEGTPPSFDNVGAGFWIIFLLLALFGLGSFIPSIAVQVRRLHDLNVSGWWYLAYMIGGAVAGEIPRVGDILGVAVTLGWIVWMFFPGTRGANKYGPDPKDPMNVEVFA